MKHQRGHAAARSIGERGHRRGGAAAIGVAAVILGALPGVLSGQTPPIPPPAPDMARLAFLVGDWDLAVEQLSPTGEVVRRDRGRVVITEELGGQLILAVGYREGSEIGQRNWKFYNQVAKKLYDVNFDLVGHFEVREETRNGGDLAFSMVEPFVGDDGVPRDWRNTYRPIDRDAFVVEIDHSADGGRTWTLAFRIRHTRRSESAPAAGGPRLLEPGPELARLEVLIGDWETAPVDSAGRPAGPGGGTVSYRWALGGTWLEEDTRFSLPDGRTRQVIGLMTFDGARGQYVGDWHDNTAARTWPFVASWVADDTLELRGSYEIGSARVRTSVRYIRRSPTEWILVQSQAVGDDPLAVAFRLRMTRAAAPPGRPAGSGDGGRGRGDPGAEGRSVGAVVQSPSPFSTRTVPSSGTRIRSPSDVQPTDHALVGYGRRSSTSPVPASQTSNTLPESAPASRSPSGE